MKADQMRLAAIILFDNVSYVRTPAENLSENTRGPLTGGNFFAECISPI